MVYQNSPLSKRCPRRLYFNTGKGPDYPKGSNFISLSLLQHTSNMASSILFSPQPHGDLAPLILDLNGDFYVPPITTTFQTESPFGSHEVRIHKSSDYNSNIWSAELDSRLLSYLSDCQRLGKRPRFEKKNCKVHKSIEQCKRRYRFLVSIGACEELDHLQ